MATVAVPSPAGKRAHGRRVLPLIVFSAFTALVLVCRMYRTGRPLHLLGAGGVDVGDSLHAGNDYLIENAANTSDGYGYPRNAATIAESGVNGSPSGEPRNKLYLGGLLPDAAFFDASSCRSRYQSSMYRRPSPHQASRYLVDRLRKYEANHRRCAPFGAGYNVTLRSLLGNGRPPATEEETGRDCKYILWTPLGGLGNRILTIASAFLYALLTDRVLLIDRGKDMAGLFCEPFPGTTWLLPSDFPMRNFDAFGVSHWRSYGNLLKNGKVNKEGISAGGSSVPSFVYIHLGDDYQTEDAHFFCEQDQAVLRTVPWLLVRSDLYFVPSLFLNQEFEPELRRLFPDRETVFHHLGRYLFHPANTIWGMIVRYHRAYLAMATKRVGIQIRIFSPKDSPFEVVYKQVIDCTSKEKLLPEIDEGAGSTIPPAVDPIKTRIAVLLASLHSGYFEKMKDMYWENSAAGDAVVSVHQPSHEEKQQTDQPNHDARAWAEMNLLSLADELVTSAWSTFGYVAQGLAGVRPWILHRLENGVTPKISCVRDISMEPCFHSPPSYVCREKKSGDNGETVSFVTHCRDAGSGLKLAGST